MVWFFVIGVADALQVAKVSGTVSVGLDLYTVAPDHSKALVSALESQAKLWQWHPNFKSCAVHQSLDRRRVFAYSQWEPRFDHRKLAAPLDEFFAPESCVLEVTAAAGDPLPIKKEGPLTHLAEFRMLPSNQPAMVDLTTEALGDAMETDGLISATFHRSLDGTRMFNYGQWTNQDAFDALSKRSGFSKEAPYWAGLAKNEFFLYDVVAVVEP